MHTYEYVTNAPRPCSVCAQQIESQYLKALPMNTPTRIRVGVSETVVTLLDANHCPGAVCVSVVLSMYSCTDQWFCAHVCMHQRHSVTVICLVKYVRMRCVYVLYSATAAHGTYV